MLPASEALKRTDQAVIEFQDSIDESKFQLIKDACDMGSYSVDWGRKPTDAELELLEELGYYYKYSYCYEDLNTIHWGPSTIKRKKMIVSLQSFAMYIAFVTAVFIVAIWLILI